MRQRRRRWLVASSSAPTESICNRIVTLLRDHCSVFKKMVVKKVIRGISRFQGCFGSLVAVWNVVALTCVVPLSWAYVVEACTVANTNGRHDAVDTNVLKGRTR